MDYEGLRISGVSKRLAAFRAANSAQEDQISSTKGTAAASGPFTRKDLDSAKLAGVLAERPRATLAGAGAERARWAKVFASPASKGRERVCATLLAADKGWTADRIIAELPHLPTDQRASANDARSDGVWANAWGAREAEQDTKPDKSPDPWAKAYGADGSEGAR